MSKQSQLNMPLPEPMARAIRYLIEQGEFASQAEYVRHLIRTDLPRRLSSLEQDKLIYERLEKAKRGGPFIAHEDVENYARARARGEKPERPQSFFS